MAQANRDAGIREAECEKAAMDVKYNTDTKIEDNSRAFKLQKAHFDKEVNSRMLTIKEGYNTMKGLKTKLGDKISNIESDVSEKDDLEDMKDLARLQVLAVWNNLNLCSKHRYERVDLC